MSQADIAWALDEGRPWVLGAHVDGVRAVGRLGMALVSYGPRGRIYVEISCEPAGSRILILPEPPEIPVEPHPARDDFVRRLEGKLVGGIMRRLTQEGGDRRVDVLIEGPPDGAAEPAPRLLVGHLFGAHATAYLAETGVVTALLRPEGGVSLGSPPPAPAAERPPGAQAALPRLHPEIAPDPETLAWSRAVARDLWADEAADALERRRREVARALERQARKAASEIAAHERAIASAAEAEGWRRRGELLKASFGRIPRGADRVRLVDYFDPAAPEVDIALDPARSPGENVQACFRKARKVERAAEVARERLERALRLRDAVRGARARVEAASTPEALDAESARAMEDGLIPRPRQPREERRRPRGGEEDESRGPRRFLSSEGLEILVGRSARENDHLTLRVAHGNDVFLHVDGRPGSHVIVRLPRGKQPSLETLLDAANLAVFFSGARDAGGAEVSYTPRKYVTKPRGASPGQVLLARRKTLRIQMEKDRLDRLLGRDEPWNPA